MMHSDPSFWIALLKDVSFPIFITVYLLFRFEKKISKLTKKIEELKDIVKKDN